MEVSWTLCVVLLVGAAEAFNSMEAMLAESFVRNKMGEIVNQFSDNSSCASDIISMAQGVITGQEWAVRMLDATSKLQSGLLEGNAISLGDFDECINVHRQLPNTSEIHGKYCIVGVDVLQMLEKLPDKVEKYKKYIGLISSGAFGGQTVETGLAICVPDTCRAENLVTLFNRVRQGVKINLMTMEEACQTNQIDYTLHVADWLAIVVIFGTISLMLTSTIYDVYLKYRRQKPHNKLLISYSVYTNAKYLFTVKKNSEQISCINGIRTISMMWIILGHRYVLWMGYPKSNYLSVLRWFQETRNGFVLGASVSVDTFLLISGILVIYVVLLAKQHGIQINVLYFYIHRYVRLTPAIAAVILIYTGPLRYLSYGPLWPLITRILEVNCQNHWWRPLLYIQNLFSHEVCVAQSWYLAVDTQLYLLAPLLFLTLPRWPRIMVPILGILVAASSYLSFHVSWTKYAHSDIVSVSMYNLVELYASTPARSCVWFIGNLFGYALFRTRERKMKIHKVVNVVLWIASLTTMVLVVYSQTYFWQYPYDRVISSLFNGFARDIWALAVGWIIFSCYHGYGGIINEILSCRTFTVLGRLTYSMYLLHLMVMSSILGSNRVISYFSNFTVLLGFWGDFMIIVLVSIFWVLAFESPIIAMGKTLLPETMKNKLKEMNDTVNGGLPRNESAVTVEPTNT